MTKLLTFHQKNAFLGNTVAIEQILKKGVFVIMNTLNKYDFIDDDYILGFWKFDDLDKIEILGNGCFRQFPLNSEDFSS